MNLTPCSLLRYMFILGAVIDGCIAASWFLIAYGQDIPNILNGHTGSGSDYELAMYVAAMFMTGWATMLAWGAIKPVARRDLLLITSGFLLLSVVIELLFFNEVLEGPGFIFGLTKRIALSILFAVSYLHSFKEEHVQIPQTTNQQEETTNNSWSAPL